MNAATLFFNSTILPGIFPRIFASSDGRCAKIFWNIWLFFNLFSLFVLMLQLWKNGTSFAELPLFRTGLLSSHLVLYNLVNYNMNLRTVVNVFESGKNWLKRGAKCCWLKSVNKIKIVAEQMFWRTDENVLFIHSSGNYIETVSTITFMSNGCSGKH